VPRAACRVPRAACRVPRAACRVPRAACRVPRAVDSCKNCYGFYKFFVTSCTCTQNITYQRHSACRVHIEREYVSKIKKKTKILNFNRINQLDNLNSVLARVTSHSLDIAVCTSLSCVSQCFSLQLCAKKLWNEAQTFACRHTRFKWV